jgi:hypothetical protein
METVADAVAPAVGRKEWLLAGAGGAAGADAMEAIRRTSEPTMMHVIS